MKKYDENISDESVWVTATPNELTKTLPFYITEAGHFNAEKDYTVKREIHDSFLLIYTIRGEGAVRTDTAQVCLKPKDAIIIDCHFPHEYHSVSDEWEFLWIHFSGTAAEALFDVIYLSDTVFAVHINSFNEFERRMKEVINNSVRNDIKGYVDISAKMHFIMNILFVSGVELSEIHNDDIKSVIGFIENNYSSQITIDDMIENIHMSKYHFIRLFHRIMGTTPYQYLTNYRINQSKMLLRTTNKTISQIAELCGFLDTSNFIAKFKKYTKQRPAEYRRDFSN